MREMMNRNAEEDHQADDAVHHVDRESAVQRRDSLAHLGGQQQRHELVHEQEEQQRKRQRQGHHPAGELRRLLAVLGGLFAQRYVGRKLQRLHAQIHGLAERSQAAQNGQLENRIFLGHARQRALFRDDLAIRLAHRDAIAVRRAHHDAFHDGLAADQRLFAAFENGQHLNMGAQAQKASDGQVENSFVIISRTWRTASAPGTATMRLMQVLLAGGHKFLLLELDPDFVANIAKQAGFEYRIEESQRSMNLYLAAIDRQAPLLLFDAADPGNLGWFSRCQFYVDGKTGAVLQTPMSLANQQDRAGRTLPDSVRLQIVKELPVTFRMPGKQPVNEQVVYAVLYNLLNALLNTGVGVCGGSIVKPLAGRTESIGTRN